MQAIDEKREFRNLLKLSKWTQAEAARQLAMTPSALSQIVRPNSPVKPSRGTLRLFNLLVQESRPEKGLKGSQPCVLCEKWEVELITSLRQLSPAARAPLLKAFGTLIQAQCAISPIKK